MKCNHYCNEPLRCPECVRRFWKWAENHTRGRQVKTVNVPAPSPDDVIPVRPSLSFYEAAAIGRSW